MFKFFQFACRVLDQVVIFVTAAFGTVLRAAGHGQRVAIVQFIKGDWNYGEAAALRAFPNVELQRIGSGFTWTSDDPAVPRALAREAWELSRRVAIRLNDVGLDQDLGTRTVQNSDQVQQLEQIGLDGVQ